MACSGGHKGSGRWIRWGWEEGHNLEACFLCRKLLGYNADIFMYIGDTPFYSKECREEQMEMDKAAHVIIQRRKRNPFPYNNNNTKTTTSSSIPVATIRSCRCAPPNSIIPEAAVA